MSYAAFSQAWPSGPPAFAWQDDAAQFDALEEGELIEHDDEPEGPTSLYELAKHLGASDEEAEHLERLYAENHRPEGIARKIEQTYHDPAILNPPADNGPWPIADWHNKSWTRRKPAAVQRPPDAWT